MTSRRYTTVLQAGIRNTSPTVYAWILAIRLITLRSNSNPTKLMRCSLVMTHDLRSSSTLRSRITTCPSWTRSSLSPRARELAPLSIDLDGRDKTTHLDCRHRFLSTTLTTDDEDTTFFLATPNMKRPHEYFYSPERFATRKCMEDRGPGLWESCLTLQRWHESCGLEMKIPKDDRFTTKLRSIFFYYLFFFQTMRLTCFTGGLLILPDTSCRFRHATVIPFLN